VALRLDPPWTLVCCAMINTLIAFYLERDYSAAVAMARRVIRTYPALPREAWLGLVLDRWQPTCHGSDQPGGNMATKPKAQALRHTRAICHGRQEATYGRA
jgi:hypothetical protein